MSATPYEPPLRAVPPLADQQERMGWLLLARRWARRTAESARAMGVRVMDTLADPQLLRQAVSRLREAALRVGRLVTAGLQWLGRRGAVAAVAAAATSGTGRQVLDQVAGTIGAAVRTVASTVSSLVDSGLRRLGPVGNRTADWLRTTVTALRQRVQPAAAAARWFARASHPNAPLGRLLGSVSRSYLLHRLLRVTVSNRWLRAVVEAFLIPAIADSALVARLRRVAADARTRAEHQRDQADGVADADNDKAAADTEQTGPAAAQAEDDQPEQGPGPSNRAERRAAKRQNRGPQQQ